MLADTRASLILRLSDVRDVQAWDEFLAIYEPLLLRVAKRQGLQYADAQELVQEVMLSVSRSVDRWDPDPQRGRFRDWLFRIARNQAINILTRPKYRTQAVGDTVTEQLLQNIGDPMSDPSEVFDLEYRREVFRWAAKQVEPQVQPTTWRAFWLTCVDGLPIAEVAESLRVSVGSVYISRSRVMAKLQTCARQIRDAEGDGSLRKPARSAP